MSQMEAKNNRYRGTCYYFGWKRLDKWCRHPDHVEEVKEFWEECQGWIDEYEEGTIEKKRISIEQLQEI
jgi:hypothetical protein